MATDGGDGAGRAALLIRFAARNGGMLAGFALAATAGIAGTFALTQARIAEQELRARSRALLEIVPPSRHDNRPLEDTVTLAAPQQLSLDRSEPAHAAFIARRGADAVAAILPAVAPDGYTGDIHLLVGVNRDGSVAGVRVTHHRETPGLGDKVELRKSDWVLSFNGASLGSPKPARWAVKKDGGDFDQFTGATITPRAVVAAVKRALEYAERQRPALFAERGGDGER